MKRLNHCVRLFRIVLFLILLTLSFASCNNFQSGDESDTANTVGDSLSETTVETLTEAPTEPETKHTHAFGDWVIMFDATCTEEGRQERTCACGEKDIQTITSMGHTEEVIAGKMATCIDTGLTEGKKCSVCGEIVKAQEIIPAGHDYNTTIWSSDDEQHWHKCRNCDAITDAADHTFIGKTCTVCGYAFQAGSEGLIFISNKDGTCYVSGIGTCQDRDVVIPPVSPAGDKVKSIAYQAFRNCERLTSITIPNSVTSIGDWAFSDCTGLTSITIPDSVTSIGQNAFTYCTNLVNISFPDNEIPLGNWVLQYYTDLADFTNNYINTSSRNYSGIFGSAFVYTAGDANFEHRLANYIVSDWSYRKVIIKYETAAGEEKSDLQPLIDSATANCERDMERLKTYIRSISQNIRSLEAEHDYIIGQLEIAESGKMSIKGANSIPPDIVNEVNNKLEWIRRAMDNQVKTEIDYSPDKMEVDTFLHVHIAILLSSCLNENSHSQVGVVGYAENLYRMLTAKEYGLRADETDLLRYINSNKDKTDDELLTKYGLAKGKPSVSGLTMFIRELLDESFACNPTLSDKTENIDNEIINYFLNMLYEELDDMSDSNILPTLNFDKTRVNENHKVVSNVTNVKATINDINKVIEGYLIGPSGTISNVVNEDYELSHILNDSEFRDIVNTCISSIDLHLLKEDTSGSEKASKVEYLTPDTMRVDVQEYIKSYYYRAAIDTLRPSTLTNKLNFLDEYYMLDPYTASVKLDRLLRFFTITTTELTEQYIISLIGDQ